MQFFFYAVLVINSVHGLLLVTQKERRGLTISEHAAKNRRTHGLYVAGHLLGGLLFLYFAHWFFLEVHKNQGLYTITIFGVAVEWVQAFVPARSKSEKYHVALAILMSVVITFLGIASALVLPLDSLTRVVCLCIGALLVLSYPVSLRLPRKYFWIIEMVNINLFYLMILLMTLG